MVAGQGAGKQSLFKSSKGQQVPNGWVQPRLCMNNGFSTNVSFAFVILLCNLVQHIYYILFLLYVLILLYILFGKFFKGKMLKNQYIVFTIFQHFSFDPPLESMEKKIVKTSSNFERLHEIIIEAFAENFSNLSQKMANPPLYLALHFLIGIPFYKR